MDLVRVLVWLVGVPVSVLVCWALIALALWAAFRWGPW
jgi:hypothetical protein